MAVDEIKDAMRTGTGAVDKVGPGNGALRRNARTQDAETALPAKLLEVRQLAGVHHLLRQSRVHPVNTYYDDSLAFAANPAGASINRIQSQSRPERGSSRCRFLKKLPAINFSSLTCHLT